jgi:hypothetical protein
MATSWTCNRCNVTATFADERLAHPDGWIQEDAEWRCLGCRRAIAVEAVQDGDSAGLAKRRRVALTEFELRRDPAAPDHLIARRVRCATSFVGEVRAGLA